MFGKGDAISMEHSEIFFEDQYILPNDFCQMDNIRNAQGGFSTLERLLSINILSKIYKFVFVKNL